MTAPPPTEIAPREAYTAANAPPREASAWPARLAAVLLVGHGILAWITRASAVETQDEATYILLSRTLRHFRYIDLQVVGTPAHSHYPPAYASFLMLLSLVFGEHLDVFIAANVAASVLSLWMLYDVMRRRVGPGTALAALALCALNPSIAYFAGRPLSETPYLLLSTVALWAALREPPTLGGTESRTNFWPVLAGAAAVIAALTRSAGVTILGAVFAYWVLERRYRRATGLAAVGALTVGSWLLWTAHAPGRAIGRSYISDLSYAPRQQTGLIQTLATRVGHNVLSYPTEALPSLLPQPTMAGTKIDNLAGLVILLIVGAAGTVVFWKRSRVLVVYLAAYAALLAAWPWNENRLLVPILPVALCLIAAGAFSVGGTRRWLRPAPFLVAGIIGATALVQDRSSTQAALSCDRSRATTSEGCFPAERLGFFAAMRYIRQSTPPDAIILTLLDAITNYYTDRQTVYPETVSASSPSEFEATARSAGVRYVLLSPLHPPDALRIPWWIQQCKDLAPVSEFPATTMLLSLPPAGAPQPQPDACADIERYLNSPTNAELWPGRAGLPPPRPGL